MENLITEYDTTPFSSKKFWGFIKSRGSEGQGVVPLKDGGRLVTDPKEKAQLLNKQFSSVFKTKTSFTEEDFEHRCPSPPDLPDIPSCPDLNITKEGVRRLIHDLIPSKACGPDGVTQRLLRTVADEICASVTLLFRASYKNGILPKDWKTAFVTPAFKKGERYKPVNYRPISFTCTACKLLEHIVTSHIMAHFEEHDVLCPEQHGFRRGRSCETQLLGYVDETTEALERGCQVDTVVLDFSKAFDKVSHALLVHKLKRYRVGGLTGAWIEDFLSERQQAVVVEGATSEYAPVESGVPQGSILGPSLFLIYINDLPSSMKSQDRLFADDTMCSNEIQNTTDQHTLQADLDSLAEWETKWAMEFHPAKCSTLSATRSRQKLEPSYQLHGQQLENVPTIKYLGGEIQENLKWSNHMTSITNKANKTLCLVRRNLKVGNKRAKETAYKALIRPKLEYAASVWVPHTQADIKTLEKMRAGLPAAIDKLPALIPS